MKIDPAFVALQSVSSSSQRVETPRVTSSGQDVTAETKVDDLFTRQEKEAPLIQSKPLPPTTLQETQSSQSEVSSPELPSTLPEESKAPSPIRTNGNGTLSVIEESPASQSQSASGEINFARLYGVDTPPASNVPQNFTSEEIERFYFASSGPEGVGELSGEGMRLYETVRAKYIDRVAVCSVGPPTLYLTGGLPGSGKGYIISKILQEGPQPQFVLVDPDEIKKDILRDLARTNPQLKEQMTENKHWGNVIHETSSAMAKRLMSDALESGRDIVFDSSMASSNVEKYRTFAKCARANGYQITGIISDVSEDTSIKRAFQRADKPTHIHIDDKETVVLPGRLTKPDYIHECAMNLHTNLNTYLEEGMYDRCMIFDNNSPTPVVSATFKREKNPDGTFSSKKYAAE